jgi:hypothetical protein
VRVRISEIDLTIATVTGAIHVPTATTMERYGITAIDPTTDFDKM